MGTNSLTNLRSTGKHQSGFTIIGQVRPMPLLTTPQEPCSKRIDELSKVVQLSSQLEISVRANWSRGDKSTGEKLIRPQGIPGRMQMRL